MDNVTHSLIGLIAGESVARHTSTSEAGLLPDVRRRLFIAMAMIGGNLPDLDLLYSFGGRTGGNLRYLLEHRGYTHTVVGCLVLSALLYGGAVAWIRARRHRASRVDLAALAWVALLATALHLAMDALNNYGVHPLWPFNDRWMYGDAVFIVEPLYWVAAAPLLFSLRSKLGRGSLILALCAAVLASLFSGAVIVGASAALIVSLVVLLWIGYRTSERTASLVSAVTFLLVTGAFVAGSQCAARRVDALARSDFPTEHVIDHVLTAMPANPLCWNVLLLQTDGDRYDARQAVLSLVPGFLSSARCANAEPKSMATAERMPITGPSGTRWREFSMRRSTLANLVDAHCDVAALMRFARAPFAVERPAGWIVGDLRFDRGPRPGFAEVQVARDGPMESACRSTPPWEPPRADLLR